MSGYPPPRPPPVSSPSSPHRISLWILLKDCVSKIVYGEDLSSLSIVSLVIFTGNFYWLSLSIDVNLAFQSKTWVYCYNPFFGGYANVTSSKLIFISGTLEVHIELGSWRIITVKNLPPGTWFSITDLDLRHSLMRSEGQFLLGLMPFQLRSIVIVGSKSTRKSRTSATDWNSSITRQLWCLEPTLRQVNLYVCSVAQIVCLVDAKFILVWAEHPYI